MPLSRIRAALRGTVAWVGGALVTLALGLAGVVDGGSLGGAARAFLDANAVPVGGGAPPTWLVIVPVAALALAGYRLGQSTTGGILGRLRGALNAITPAGRSAERHAAVAGAGLAAGYALTAAAAAVLVGRGAGAALVSSLVLGLVVTVPAAVLGTRR